MDWHGSQHPVANFAFPTCRPARMPGIPDDRNLNLAHPHKTPYWMWKTQAASQ